MAQEQPGREGAQGPEVEPIKYGDVFYVSPQAADKPILPDEAAAMQTAEKVFLGLNPLGGPASLMHSAASFNQQAGLVDPAAPNLTDQIRVTEADVGGTRIITESMGDQVVGQFVEQRIQEGSTATRPENEVGGEKVTIGGALEAAARCAGDEPIDMAGAAAIEAAEKRAIGANAPPRGGLASEAYAAAAWNAEITNDELMTTIDDVLKDASEKLGQDKVVTQEDAKEVVKAEMKNDPDMATTIGGVAEMMAIAASLNES